jgi:DNA polymerase III subunit alpha
VIQLTAASCTAAVIGKLKELLGAHPGATPVQVRFVSAQGTRPLEVGTFRVSAGEGLLSELRLLMGPDAAALERPRPPAAAVPVRS